MGLTATPLQFALENPTEAVEATFFRIQQEQMADVPILNPALQVEAVDFQRWQGHWLGVIVTPWCMNLLMVPASQENWESVGTNKRRFVHFPRGDFAFLGSESAELGEYQSCSLFSPMANFPNQTEAVLTARASLLGLLAPLQPAAPVAAKGTQTDGEGPSMSRRRFFSLGSLREERGR